MKKLVLLGGTLGAVLLGALMIPALAHAPWHSIVPLSVSITPQNPNLTKLSLTATGTIPKQTPDLAGFAWLYAGGPNSAYAITTHEGVRDSNQNPDGWHAHNVVFGAAPVGFPSDGPSLDGVVADLCIAAISGAPTAGIATQKSSLSVNARTSTLTGSFAGTAAAFDIVVDADCPPTAPTPLTLGMIIHIITP